MNAEISIWILSALVVALLVIVFSLLDDRRFYRECVDYWRKRGDDHFDAFCRILGRNTTPKKKAKSRRQGK